MYSYILYSFVFYILCIYLATAKRTIEEGWNILITYEYVYGCLISDERMSSYKIAFKHIVWSCLAFVLSYMKKENELNTVKTFDTYILNFRIFFANNIYFKICIYISGA